MKKFLFVLLAALGAGAWWYYQNQGEKAPEYQTIAVTEGPMTQAVTATGTLNPVINVTVGSQISGYFMELHADFNSPVQKDQVIARLDPATYRATVHQNEGDVA